jgi:hypothetical protein
MVWFIEKQPYMYKGVRIFPSGMGLSRLFANDGIDYPVIERVADAKAVLAKPEERDVFSMSFRFDERSSLFLVGYASGITRDEELPSATATSTNLQTWDFRACAPDAVAAWSLGGANKSCVPHRWPDHHSKRP